MTDEEWVKCIYNEIYSVSNNGRIRNDKTSKILLNEMFNYLIKDIFLTSE